VTDGLNLFPAVGPRVTRATLAAVRLATASLYLGDWPAKVPQEVAVAATGPFKYVFGGIYLWVDGNERLRWLGKARRGQSVRARLRQHLRHPERQAVFEAVYVFEIDPWAGNDALEAIEGKAAEVLRLRDLMPGHRWPDGSRWEELVAGRRTAAR
jgi:hypothetical protein